MARYGRHDYDPDDPLGSPWQRAGRFVLLIFVLVLLLAVVGVLAATQISVRSEDDVSRPLLSCTNTPEGYACRTVAE